MQGIVIVALHRSGSALTALLALALGACNSTASVPPAVVASAAPLAPVLGSPGSPGCAPQIARTRAVVDSDVATGNLNAPVGARFRADLDRAQTACAAGRDGAALAELSAAKARYGYP